MKFCCKINVAMFYKIKKKEKILQYNRIMRNVTIENNQQNQIDLIFARKIKII